MSGRDVLPQPRLFAAADSPQQLRLQGSAWAQRLLRLAGWRLEFDGLPAKQGVILVYPHTSNWDFVVGILAKWALGLQLRFWAKDSLFRLPLFGAWVRWLGGVAVRRDSPQGLVSDTVQDMLAAQARGEMYWLAMAPEGTRSLAKGWRSGAYQVALQAQVPAGLAYFDYASKTICLRQFMLPGGDPATDLALMAQTFSAQHGFNPALASPIRMKS
ncbi:1-acyl-sn-glycerol-3-phosphate acyltransferase [Paucibacter sp. KCTC 42545]|uniref:1-acyl-sn-glycerol-3-phosphate acyltransferase n=1 Tax=Paucibacter sp. KCTC 42545 TaxID=1768242 RepID=UPI0009E86DF9|nr:1-acyl-sn-glycerol-3-phosphate acyltransferase [Paucibacter sp. KCTC 42545]